MTIETKMDSNLLEKLERFKLPLALSFLGIVLIIGGIFASGLQKTKSRDFPKESLTQNQKMISVDVSGAVNKPGVYQLSTDSRIEDAIKIAGGFSEESNQEYISKSLNLAQKLSDGSKIYVPFAGDSAPVGAGQGQVAGVATGKININTASQGDLESLPDIASVRASSIISGRPYQTVADLLNKKIITKAVFEKIKDQIVVY